MIEKLFEEITKRNHHVVEMMNMFGEDYWYVEKELLEITGMKKAFEIIAGHSYVDHILSI